MFSHLSVILFTGGRASMAGGGMRDREACVAEECAWQGGMRGGGCMAGQGGHILAKMKFPVFSMCYKNFPRVIFT